MFLPLQMYMRSSRYSMLQKGNDVTKPADTHLQVSRYRPARAYWAGTKELPPTSCEYRNTYIRRRMASLPQQVPRC